MGDETLIDDVVALYVDPRGPYPGLVREWYDEARDARTYAGPWPVVAHPPCARWCRLAGLVEARWGHKRGEDGGLFAFALECVRRYGGVLEHPAYSDAWDAFDLPKPPTGGGWVRGIDGGWSCYVEQHRYGHAAKKATWLYLFGGEPLPGRWGSVPDQATRALVSWCGNHVSSNERRPRLGHKAAIHSPPAFAEWLISLARQARRPGT
jgi:hypothetical protein